jgi:transcriptional regulator with XRE-family HTH domain
MAASRRYARLDGHGQRGTTASVAFGALAADLRAGLGLSRTQLAARGGLNPVYLAMLETGLLAPDEIPGIAVARLAIGLGRTLRELPLTPYAVGEEPADEVEEEPVGGVRLHPGLETLRPWVDARVTPGATGVVCVVLPDCSFRTPRGTWRVSTELSSSPVASADLDDYSWHLIGGSDDWWAHLRVVDRGGRPVAGAEVQVEVGSRRGLGVTDAGGQLRVDRIDAADIEPVRLVAR